jgi:hypothetical protein
MGDWPKDALDMSVFGGLSSVGEGSMAGDYTLNLAQINANVTNGLAANSAVYVPVIVRNQVTVYQMGWSNGSSIAGNLDVGIYDRYANRLVSSGSTAQATVSVLQLVDITDLTLPPDLYFLALAGDNPGTQFVQNVSITPTTSIRPGTGVYSQATAFPLPTTATFTTGLASGRMPLIFGAIEGATF